MNKRYQVFVSSTYTDLIEERAEVMQALLELDCMPAGMELFPAASEQQWSWIKKVIDESDYYLVILGGRYGTISEATGMSYTEMEYRYALEAGKPVIGFLHEDPSKIETGKSETSPQAKKRLDQFRRLVEQRLCKFWTSPVDLGAKVSRSITQLIKHQPAIGWVRADQISSDSSAEATELRKKIQVLEEKLEKASLQEPIGAEALAKGKDKLTIKFSLETKKPKVGQNGATYWIKGAELGDAFETTWDDVFSYLAPELIGSISEYHVINRLNNYILARNNTRFSEKFPNEKVERIRIYSSSFDVIKIQLRALKLITIEEKDKWVLSSYGDNYMTKLLAVHKRKSK